MHIRRNRRAGKPRALLTSTSLATLLIGAGPAFACDVSHNGNSVASVTNATSIDCIAIQGGASIGGNVTNAAGGAITAPGGAVPFWTGISIDDSTVAGSVINQGSITSLLGHGILVEAHAVVSGGINNSGTILVEDNGIYLTGVATFAGGISNSGTISQGTKGIYVASLESFSGGINNSSMISSDVTGIAIGYVTSVTGGINNSGTIMGGNVRGIFAYELTNFSGGISNSGMISSNGAGIFVEFVTTFAGGINNSGTISQGTRGIYVSNLESFSGGINNNGMIVGASTADIAVDGVTSFSGGISNARTISGGNNGIVVENVTSFGGGISNSGDISVGGSGISVSNVSTFSSGISNSGTISSRVTNSIYVGGVSNFSGGISNSGTIAATQIGIVVNSMSTFSGNISNSGTISAASGIVVDSGVVFASGAAIINSGTIIGATAAIDASAATSPVVIDQTAGSISGAIKLSAFADVLNVSGGAIAGNIVGQGSSNTLNFAMGSGNTFTYGAAYGFSGVNQVNVNSGAVILDGANSAANVAVNSGLLEVGDASNAAASLTATNGVDVYGTLAGHGAINGNVAIADGGALSPGGSIGTLTINGNLSMAPGSFYDVEISPTLASKTQVNGTATLGGATVQTLANLQIAGLGSYAGKTYTILTSTHVLGAGNVFTPNVTVEASGATSAEQVAIANAAVLTYNSNNVYLSTPSYLVTLALPSNAPLNAQNAAGAINTFIIAGGTPSSGFQTLATLSGSALNRAANQLAGQGQGAFAPVGFTAGDMFLNVMLDAHIDGRSGPAPLACPEERRSPTTASGSATGASQPREFCDPRFSLWATAYGDSGTISGSATTGAADTTNEIYGLAAGVDYHVTANTLVGVAVGGGGTSWQLGQGMGDGHSGMFQAGVYGTTRNGPAYLSGALAYSLQEVATSRTVTLAGADTLHGGFAANMASARLEAGYRLPYGGLGVTPYGAVQAQDMALPGYDEYAISGSSQFALNYASRNDTATRTEIGARFDSDAFISQGLKLYGRLAWAHDFDNEGQSAAFFQSLPSSTFQINSAKPARDGALVTTGLDYKLAGGWSMLAKFDGEFSSTTTIFAGSGTIKKVW